MPVVQTPVKQYVKVAVSYDQKKVAFLSENGLVQITSSDMKVPERLQMKCVFAALNLICTSALFL